MLKSFLKRITGKRSPESKSTAISIGSEIALVVCSDDSVGGGGSKYYFSVLPPDQIFKSGLLPQAIVGEYREPLADNASIELDKFSANTVFKDFLHEVIASCWNLPDVVQEAKRIGRGVVTIIDRRVPDMNAAIKPGDILGGYLVENGEVTGYSRNPNHVLLNEFGFFVLEVNIRTRLISALEGLSEKG